MPHPAAKGLQLKFRFFLLGRRQAKQIFLLRDFRKGRFRRRVDLIRKSPALVYGAKFVASLPPLVQSHPEFAASKFSSALPQNRYASSPCSQSICPSKASCNCVWFW